MGTSSSVVSGLSPVSEKFSTDKQSSSLLLTSVKKSLSSKSIQDDSEAYKTKVDSMKSIMQTDNFRLDFMKFIELQGKSYFITCFQILESWREALKSSQNSESVLSRILSEYSFDDDMISSERAIHESVQLIEELQRCTTNGHALDANATYQWLKRIAAAQEHILACLFKEFEQFLESEEFQSIHTPRGSFRRPSDMTYRDSNETDRITSN